METFFSYITHKGELYDAWFNTREEAVEAAFDDFQQRCEDDEIQCIKSETVEIVEFFYDEATDGKDIIEKTEEDLEYGPSTTISRHVWYKGGVL